MENAIPSLVIGAILLIASSLMARTSLHSYDQLSDSMKDMQVRLSEQVKTRITITDIAVAPTGDTVSVTVRNDGQTRIASYDRLDLILTYYDSPATRSTLWLPYSTDVAANTWTLASIDNDFYEPGIVNPGETAHFEIALDTSISPSKPNFIVIGSESGASVTASFSS